MKHYCKYILTLYFLAMAINGHSQNSDIYKYGVSNGLRVGNINKLNIDQDNNIYLYGIDDEIILFDGTDFIDIKSPKVQSALVSSALSEAARHFDIKYPHIKVACSTSINDQSWIGTQINGIYVLSSEGDIVDRINIQDGLSINHVTGIVHDKWNNIYFSTIDGGFYAYRPTIFNSILSEIDDNITSISTDQKQNLWIGTADNGLYVYKGSDLLHLGGHSSFTNSKVNCIFPDSKGRVWIGTQDDGLYYYDQQERMISFQDDELLSSHKINDVIQDEGDRLWIATANQGIILLQEGDSSFFKLRTFDSRLSSGLNKVKDIEWTKDRLWFVTYENGIGWIDFKNYKINLLEHASYNLPRIVSKITAHKNYIFVATDEGVYRLTPNSKESTKVHNKDLDATESFNEIYLDHKNNIWISDLGKLYQINFTEDGFKKSEFTPQEGIPLDRINVIYKRYNEIILGSDSGLYQSSQVENFDYAAPDVEVEDIRLFYESLDPIFQTKFKSNSNKTPKFKYDQNHLGFTFKGRLPQYQEELLYSYRLIGVDDRWSPPSSNNELNFANLPSGKMTLEVKAIHPRQQNLSSEVKSIQFWISTPIWKYKWFPLLPIGFTLLLGYLYYSYRIKIIQRETKVKEDQLKLKNNLLDLERSALQLQMNPHFIFNALNTVKKELRNNDIQTSEKILTQFSNLMRNTLEHSREDHISLEDEIELLHNYLSIEQISRNNSFTFEIDHELDEVFDIEIPPMMLQPFVENAVIHGVAHKTNGLIKINFIQKGQMIVCSIMDNGDGLKKTSNGKSHQSLAIQVTRERLSLLNNTRKEHLYIRNRTSENGTIQGVEVELWLPIV